MPVALRVSGVNCLVAAVTAAVATALAIVIFPVHLEGQIRYQFSLLLRVGSSVLWKGRLVASRGSSVVAWTEVGRPAP